MNKKRRRIREMSTEGNIIVWSTVTDLVAGLSLKFKDLGARTFEGVDGMWRLFRVLT